MRFLLRLVGIGFVLLLVLAVGGLMLLDRGAKAAVEHGATRALSATTTLSSVSLRPFAGSLDLEGLRVGNPPGFSDRAMLELGGASMQVSLASLWADEVEVPRFELSGLHLRVEGQGLKTNVGAVVEGLKSGGAPKPAPAPGDADRPKDGQEASAKRFVVRELVIRDVRIVADYSISESLGKSAAASEITVPEIRLSNVGNGKSLSIEELTLEIFKALLDAAAAGKLPGLSAELGVNLKRDLSDLKDKARDIGKEAEGALKGVKDLFKKD